MLPLRLALKDLRGTRPWLFILCLAVGVTVIASVTTLAAMIERALEREAKPLLGGDAEISQTYRPLEEQVLKHLERSGKVSRILEMRTMAQANNAATLVEVKGADSAYPLYGKIELEPQVTLAEAVAGGGIVVAEELMQRLSLKLGEPLKVGDATFTVKAVLKKEPDGSANIFTFGPRVIVSDESLEQYGLTRPGSLPRYNYRVALPEDTDAEIWKRQLEEAFPEAPWRVRTYKSANTTLERNLRMLTQFFLLIGLAALLAGGIGVMSAASSHLKRKLPSIAILKSFGASQRMIFAIYFIEILLLAAIGVAIGLVIGAGLPLIAVPWINPFLPVTLEPTLFPNALMIAGGFGMLSALAFSIWPLGQAMRTRPASLFRGLQAELPLPSIGMIALTEIAFGLLAAAIVGFSGDPALAMFFVMIAGGAFLFFLAVAKELEWISQRLKVKHMRLRLAISNIGRPGALTVPLMIALGTGMTLLVTIALIDGALREQLRSTIPARAPTHFFIDIPPQDVERFHTELVANGATDIHTAPMVRANIVKLNGRRVGENDVHPDARWALRGERGLTFAALPPPNAVIAGGKWWPENYPGPPLVSMDGKLAQDLGLRLGDTITYNVLGREIEATVTSFRQVNYQSLEINFSSVLSPGVLEDAPHSYIATIRTSPADEARLAQAVARALPGIGIIRIRQVVENIANITEQASVAIRIVALIMLLAGTLSVAAAFAATIERRSFEAVVLKVLGATRRDVFIIVMVEYVILTIAAALLAFAIGSYAAYGLSKLFRFLEFSVQLGPLIPLMGFVMILVLLVAFIGGQRVWCAKPISYLRNE